ncbi:glycoside hydrolase family 25 protein [Paenibacillus sp. KQZ6P-2]|uniref:Glycoside hydrolase family 25 protein n=1 Tax=Paenibacillus mangrovi TaxID=2931978 RepID=A0A9X2B7P8_9BACL|nr:glycoside hydrolase family 25 protein [Paenibacillus mangrovi]MCJ8015212.1 glycoside hydrolase family 25 protein [Paenibacillus mangrovi]
MQSRSKGNAQGIDVSHHQGVIDWPKVAAAGISFVFIKATQNNMDPKFIENVNGAKAAGLLVGAYHYLDDSVTTVDKARTAAQSFNKVIQTAGGPDVFDLPFVLDYESNKNKLTSATITSIAKAFLEEIQHLTCTLPMLYTYPSFIGNFSGLTDYPLWIARYHTVAPVDASGWKRWEFWQYSDGGVGDSLPNGIRKVPGINGNVDLNEFDGTVEQLRSRYCNKQSGKDDVKMTDTTSDINKVSPWAADAWEEATANGYVDGTRPGATVTREEMAIIVNRLRKNFLTLIAGNTDRIAELERQLQQIEKG